MWFLQCREFAGVSTAWKTAQARCLCYVNYKNVAALSRIHLLAFNSEYTIPTKRSALVPVPAGKSPPGTCAS